MNDFAKLALSCEAKNLPIKHIPGPEGVRGRNSGTVRYGMVRWCSAVR